MRILDRYILKSVLGVFFACLLTFLMLYIIADVFSNLDDILKSHAPIIMLLQYYLSFLPSIFVQVSPIACLLATLYTFSKLNRDNEIIAMRASGLSIYQISKTVIVFGVVISIFVFFVNDKLVPKYLAVNHKIRAEIDAKREMRKKESENITNLSVYGMKNRLFFINQFSPSTNTMEGITILEHDEHQNVTRKIVANKGVFENGLWKFYNCISYTFDENGQIKSEPQFSDEEIMPITEKPKDFITNRQSTEYMTISELDKYVWKLSKSGANSVVRRLKVELYQRFTVPLTSLVIILLGIPFALKMKRRATGISSLGLSIMMGFLYYVANAVSIAFGVSGILTPFLAASLSHILALAFSIYMISKLP